MKVQLYITIIQKQEIATALRTWVPARRGPSQ